MPKIPGIHHQAAIRAFQKAGFVITRQGKHNVMPDGERTLFIPRANPINPFTMGGIARDAGLTPDQSKIDVNHSSAINPAKVQSRPRQNDGRNRTPAGFSIVS